jgi:hypothetical protein
VRRAVCLSALLFMLAAPVPAGADVSIAGFSVTPSTLLAGAHPRLSLVADFAYSSGLDDVRDVTIRLAPGLWLDPAAAHRCASEQWARDPCPPESVVGSAEIGLDGQPQAGSLAGSLVNLTPSRAELARLGILIRSGPALGSPIRLEAPVALVPRADAGGLEITLGGVPERIAGPGGVTQQIRVARLVLRFRARGSTGSGRLVRNPTACRPAASRVSANSYLAPLSFGTATASLTPTGCSRLELDTGVVGLLGERATGRGDRPRLTLLLAVSPRGSAVSRAVTTLPSRLGALDLGRRRGCSPLKLRQDRCPPASVAGRVRIRTAFAAGPSTGGALTGEVLVSEGPSGSPPTFTIRFRRRVPMDIEGRFVRHAGRTRLVLEGLPDMPLFDLSILLRSGFLQATGDLCGAPLRGRARLNAHSGASVRQPARFVARACRRYRQRKPSSAGPKPTRPERPVSPRRGPSAGPSGRTRIDTGRTSAAPVAGAGGHGGETA